MTTTDDAPYGGRARRQEPPGRTVAKVRGLLDGLEVDVAESLTVIRRHLDRIDEARTIQEEGEKE